MENIMKDIRDNIFTIVSVNKSVREEFSSLGLRTETIRDLLTLCLRRVTLPTVEDVMASRGEHLKSGYDSPFALDCCKACNFIEGKMVSTYILESGSKKPAELPKNVKRIINLAESKLFIRLQESLYSFRQAIKDGEIKSLENYNTVNPHFSTTKELKKALKECPGYGDLTSEDRKMISDVYFKDIIIAVLNRTFELNCLEEFRRSTEIREDIKDAIQSLPDPVEEKPMVLKPTKDSTDDFLQSFILVGVGMVIGIILVWIADAIF